MLLLGYFAGAFADLLALTAMIMAIARALGDCPIKGRRARPAGITIATGYPALGSGAVLLIGAGVTPDGGVETIFFCLGLLCVGLGLGFTQAVSLLRAVVDGLMQPQKDPQPTNRTPAIDPVLA